MKRGGRILSNLGSQKLKYAKSKTDTLAKLDGTYKQPQAAAPAQPPTSSLQQSVFKGPPGSAPGALATNLNSLPPPRGLLAMSPPPPAFGLTVPVMKAASTRDDSPANATTPASQGTKRGREDSDEESSEDEKAVENKDEEDDEAPMEMDEDDGAPMDESDGD